MEDELNEVLSLFGIQNVIDIQKIYKSAWKINNTYVLKRSFNSTELDKSISLSNMLIEKNIPVAKYLTTIDGKSYAMNDNAYYCLMSKMSGEHINPYVGDIKNTGKMLGNIVANLHLALKDIGSKLECYDAYYIKELDGWISEEIKAKQINIRKEIIYKCFAFKPLYSTLPRQLIHRDIHLGNLMFEKGKFMGYLDFDISQKNARILDICYLGASMLVGNYQHEDRFSLWCEIFDGVLEGYEEISLFTQSEKESIPIIFVLIELTFVAFFSQIGQSDSSQSCVHMTNWLYDNMERLNRWQ